MLYLLKYFTAIKFIEAFLYNSVLILCFLKYSTTNYVHNVHNISKLYNLCKFKIYNYYIFFVNI